MAQNDDYLAGSIDQELARARVAALNVLHGRAGARFLAAHGRYEHAGALDAALDEMADLLRAQIGEPLFSAALAWAARHLEGDDSDAALTAH